MEPPRPPEAEALLQRAGDGDDEAFSEFYDRFAPFVYGLVGRIVRDPGTAEDVACDVFVQAWRQSQDFEPSTCSALGWLLDLAHRHAVDAARSRTGPGAAHERSTADIDCAELRQLLGALPGDDRRSVEQAYNGALDYHEVASACHLSPDAVKSSMYDAMARLRESTDARA